MDNNFTLTGTFHSDDYKGDVSVYVHGKTGFPVVYFSKDDNESFFSYLVYTPPVDSSGVYHIIEHTVLSGSRKYPVKDAFSKALSYGVPSFMNAMTGVDRTYYLAASPVKKDFDNIFKVYTDAIFDPLMRKETFMQEGIRISFEGKPHFEGVVFSEMEGASSQHESVLSSLSARPLFPSSPFSFESGGRPDEIAKLDYERYMKAFENAYVPGNMALFLYGKMDIEEKLDFLDSEYLSKREGGKRIERVRNVPRTGVIERRGTSFSQDEKDEGKASVMLSWRLSDAADRMEQIIIQIVVDLLLGSPGCPLYSSIVSSDLGEDLSSESGYVPDYIDNVFSVGFSGARESDKDKISDFLLSTLKRIATEGFGEKEVEAALRRFEFNLREIPGGLPLGMRVFFRLDRALAYGADIFQYLSPRKDMAELGKLVREDKDFFSKWIMKNLVENPDRLLSVVVMDKKEEKRNQDALERILEERLGVEARKDSELFSAFQKKVDTPEEERNFVHLEEGDIEDVEFRKNPVEEDGIAYQSLYTSGITYFDLAIDVSDFSSEELALLTLYSRLMTMQGVDGMDLPTFQTEMRYNTGSFAPYLETGCDVNGIERAFLIVRMKVLKETGRDAVALLVKLLKNGVFKKDEIKAALTDILTDYQSGLIQNGHTFAITLSGEDFSPSLYLGEHLTGVSYWFSALSFLSDIDSLPVKLEKVVSKMLSRDRMSVNITSDEETKEESTAFASLFLSSFSSSGGSGDISHPYKMGGRKKVYHLPSSVSYMALASPFSNLGFDEIASDKLFLSILSNDLLWDKVRAKGGAYGVGALSDSMEMAYYFYSYRDPRIDGTLDDFFSSVRLQEIDCEKLSSARFQVKSNDLKVLAPAQKSKIYLRRRLFGISDEYRINTRKALSKVTLDDLENSRERIFRSMEKESSVALFSSRALVKASSYFEEGEDLPF